MMRFLRELKRRRVLHTASIYVVGAWIALQVVEVLSEAGLPPGTMRHLLLLLILAFPAVLVAGWYFDVSSEGITRTQPMADDEQLPPLNLVDRLLLTGLLAVVCLGTWVLSVPPSATDSPASPAIGGQQRTVAILDFVDTNASAEDGIGESLAGDLRSSLTRIAGLKVLGPETSRALGLAGDNRLTMARELAVTALLLGEVMLDGKRLSIRTRLVDVPGGEELWSKSVDRPVAQAADLQNGLASDIVRALALGLDPNPAQARYAEAGTCSAVYDIYLRGKQLSQARRMTQAELYQRGMQLLREAVRQDDQCALAWEAIAVGEVNWTVPGFAKAGAAARRALEINDALPEAWTVLAEIAEEEERWNESEDFFLRALYADPTNVRANYMYSEALLARGRARDALHHALEAYRFEPASATVNWRVTLAAIYAVAPEINIKHSNIAAEVAGEWHPFWLDSMAEGYLQKGETGRALETWGRMEQLVPDWFPDCVLAREDPGLILPVLPALRATLDDYVSGQLSFAEAFYYASFILRCSSWLDQPDLVFELLDARGVPPFEDGAPTEVRFINMFLPSAVSLRQDPRFRVMVLESGLLDYWKKWGWADLCAPDGDSFRCD
jgi:TolB-like protein